MEKRRGCSNPGWRSSSRRAEIQALPWPLWLLQEDINLTSRCQTTGPEIWEQTNGGIDVLVSGVGTGGTITGVSRYIKGEKKKKILSVAVEPVESPVITQRLAGEELTPGPHKIQGIGAGFIPDTLDLSMVDRVEQVTSEEAIEHARRLAREGGFISGVSSGAAIAVALRLARSEAFKGKTIVTILPDAGERYLTGPLFEGVFNEAGLPTI